MTHQVVVTAVGPDRKGLVGEFTGLIHKAGANLADSRKVNLEGNFALIVLVEGEDEALGRVQEDLRARAASLGMIITFSERGKAGPTSKDPTIEFRLKTYSMDQPGIVHRVTNLLQAQGINIEELETRLDSAPFTGSDVFTMEILMAVPKSVSVKALRKSLEEIGDELNCDIDLDPA